MELERLKAWWNKMEDTIFFIEICKGDNKKILAVPAYGRNEAIGLIEKKFPEYSIEIKWHYFSDGYAILYDSDK